MCRNLFIYSRETTLTEYLREATLQATKDSIKDEKSRVDEPSLGMSKKNENQKPKLSIGVPI